LVAIATERREAPPSSAGISLPLFIGFTVAATGGPLALAALNVPDAVSSVKSIGLTSLVAPLLFAGPVLIWCRYSRRMASSGGLFSFVEAAAGRRAALFQGAVWLISYALYLPYTIAYIVYDLLPVVEPGVKEYRPYLEILLPLGISVLGVARIRTAMRLVAAVAVAQMALVVILGIVGMTHLGVAAGSFAVHGPASTVAKGTANVSLLFVCGSLGLFLGAETTGGRQTVVRGLPVGVGLAAVGVVVGSLMWARAGRGPLAATIPGMAVAQGAVGHWFAVLIGLGVVASVAGVVTAEYFAVTRVLHAMTGALTLKTTFVVAATFIATSAIALVNPDAFYNDLLKPSLIALWVSQLVVVLVYPRFEAAGGRLRPGPVALAAAAAALMGYGLYSAITVVSGT
jgi:amino acid transporter